MPETLAKTIMSSCVHRRRRDSVLPISSSSKVRFSIFTVAHPFLGKRPGFSRKFERICPHGIPMKYQTCDTSGALS